MNRREAEQAALRESAAVREARSARLRALSAEERVEHLHALCAQMAVLAASRSDGAA